MPTGRPARRAASAAAIASSSGWPGPAGGDAVEEQVVDRARQHHRLEVRAGQAGQRVELVERLVVVRADEPDRQLVERALGAGGVDRRELGRQRRARWQGVEHPRLAWTAKGTIC